MLKWKCGGRLLLLAASVFFCLAPFPVRAEGPADGGDKSEGFIFSQDGYDPSGQGPVLLPAVETVYSAGGGQIL